MASVCEILDARAAVNDERLTERLGRAFAQREQRNAETRIVTPELASGCRGGSQDSIVLCAPVVSVPRAACNDPRPG